MSTLNSWPEDTIEIVKDEKRKPSIYRQAKISIHVTKGGKGKVAVLKKKRGK